MSAAVSDTFPRKPQLMLTYNIRRGADCALLSALLAAQACAAVLLYDSGADAEEAAFQRAAEKLVPLIQRCGLPALLAENSVLCGRVKADGLHIEEQNSQTVHNLAAMREKYEDKRLLGYGNPHSRHAALEAGEQRPDYLFFGKLGMDKKPAPHSRNLALAAWWADIVQIDCVVQAGSELESLAACLAAKADFIALEEAVFGAADPLKALAAAHTVVTGAAAQ